MAKRKIVETEYGARVDLAITRARATAFEGDVRVLFTKAQADRSVLVEEVERLRSISTESEIPCCRCGGAVVEFSVPNDVWNTLVREHGKETDQEYLCVACFARLAAEKVERQQGELVQVQVKLRSARHLAYHCAEAVCRRQIGSRSAIGDALLDFLKVGGIDGPRDVPTWMAEYEAAEVAGRMRR